MNKWQRVRNDSFRAFVPNTAELKDLGDYLQLQAYVIKRAIDDLASPNIMLAVDGLMFFVYNDEDSLLLTNMTHAQFVKECIMERKKEHGHTKYVSIGVQECLADCLKDLDTEQEEYFFELLRERIIKTIQIAHRRAKSSRINTDVV